MGNKKGLLAAAALSIQLLAAQSGTLRYTEDGQLVRPDDYREWIFLTSGAGMTYGPAAAGRSARNPFFDNVFVNPDSYRAFLRTGRWPDKTVFILEIRTSASHASINQGGHFQTDIAAIEAEVKDESRAPDTWSYYAFGGAPGAPGKTAKALPKTAGCLACHTGAGAVENTFTQFYPTLLPVAQKMGTVKASFKPFTASPATLFHTAETQDWNSVVKLLQEAKADDPDAAILEERTLNTLGYQLIAAGKKDQAIQLLKWVTVQFPESANAYDSLAEAYETAGDKRQAIEASRKALALLDHDPSLNEAQRKQLAAAIQKRLDTTAK
jgi:tetratricopeptide (TPR) repeat protein